MGVKSAISREVVVAGGAFAPGHLLSRIVPFEMVDEALARTGKTQERIRDLPSRVVVYLLLAGCMFPGMGWRQVWQRMTAGLEGLVAAAPTAGALAQARRRVGAACRGGLLTQIHPSLERVLGPRLQHPAILTLLERFGSPAQIRHAGRRRLVTLLRPKAPRMTERLVEDIFTALDEQTVTVPGAEAAGLIVPSLARSLTAVLDQRKLLAGRIEELLDAHPLSKVLTSMPGVGVRTGVRILIEVGDGSTFPTAGHLAAYAGLAPATQSSGSSIRGEQPSRRGNKQLKRAYFLSAFAALADPASRTYYDKKIAQDKHHTQALLCLARRRADVLFAMLRDGTFYEPRPASAG